MLGCYLILSFLIFPLQFILLFSFFFSNTVSYSCKQLLLENCHNKHHVFLKSYKIITKIAVLFSFFGIFFPFFLIFFSNFLFLLLSFFSFFFFFLLSIPFYFIIPHELEQMANSTHRENVFHIVVNFEIIS